MRAGNQGRDIGRAVGEVSMCPDQPASVGEPGRYAAPARLAARVGSLVPAAADPHTRAITIWNGAPLVGGGWITVDLNLRDDAEGYELVDVEGGPVPHRWLGDTGMPPIRLDLSRTEIPDLEGIMAHVDGAHVLGRSIPELSMRVLRDTLHIEVTLGNGTGLARAELAESLRDALSLADDGGCGRVALTIHCSALRHVAAWVSMVPAWGYTTLLLRPHPKAASRARKVVALPTEWFAALEQDRHDSEAGSLESPQQHAFPYAIGHGDGKQHPLPELTHSDAGALYAHVGPCAEGDLPLSASLVTVSPETVMVSAFQWTGNGEEAVLRLANRSDRLEDARVELLLPAQSAELTDLEDHADEILWEGEPRTAFTVAVPSSGVATVRVRWAAEARMHGLDGFHG